MAAKKTPRKVGRPRYGKDMRLSKVEAPLCQSMSGPIQCQMRADHKEQGWPKHRAKVGTGIAEWPDPPLIKPVRTEPKFVDEMLSAQRELIANVVRVYDQAELLTLHELQEVYRSITAYGTDHEDGRKADDDVQEILRTVIEQRESRA